MIKFRPLSDSDKRWMENVDYYFFAFKLGSFIIKLYHTDNFFEMNIGTCNRGRTLIVASKEAYIDMYGEDK